MHVRLRIRIFKTESGLTRQRDVIGGDQAGSAITDHDELTIGSGFESEGNGRLRGAGSQTHGEYRKEDRRSDLWFAIAWTLFHAFTLYLGMRRFSSEAPPQIWGGLLHTFVVVAFCGLPLVANLVYLVTIRRRIMEAG